MTVIGPLFRDASQLHLSYHLGVLRNSEGMGGANHVLIDIPLGPSAKVRTLAEAERLGGLFHAVSDHIDLRSMLKSPTRTRP
jgi:hypothetical protein